VDLSTPTWGGQVHPAYANARPEVTAVIPASARHVLDVGCSTGLVGEVLRSRGHRVTGIERDPALAAEARGRLDLVVEGDVEALAAAGTDPGGPYDCVLFADVLEHLVDPWAAVRWGAGLLAPGGVLVVSVPNVRHLATFWNLAVRRRWPYHEVGIFDRTHLRFFTRRNLPELLTGTGLRIEAVRRVPMLSPFHGPWLNRAAGWLGDLGALQLVMTAGRPPGQ